MSPCIVRHVRIGKQGCILGPRHECCMSNRATQYVQKYGVFCHPNSFQVLGLERRGGCVVDCSANYYCYLTRLSIVVKKNKRMPTTGSQQLGLAQHLVQTSLEKDVKIQCASTRYFYLFIYNKLYNNRISTCLEFPRSQCRDRESRFKL